MIGTRGLWIAAVVSIAASLGISWRSAPDAAAKPAATTTTVALNSRTYAKGNCIIWNNRATGLRNVEVLDCSQPHFMEMTGKKVHVPGRRFPSPDQWRAFLASACTPRVEAYLGHALDPTGKYNASAIQPSQEAWNAGDHEVQCSIGGRTDGSGKATSVVGRADPNDQAFVYSTGTCFGQDPVTTFAVVDCPAPHVAEVTGVVDLSGRLDHAPAGQELYDVAGADCRGAAEAYLGRPLDGDLLGAPLHISGESWAAGTRKINCFVGRYDGNQLVPLAGPLR